MTTTSLTLEEFHTRVQEVHLPAYRAGEIVAFSQQLRDLNDDISTIIQDDDQWIGLLYFLVADSADTPDIVECVSSPRVSAMNPWVTAKILARIFTLASVKLMVKGDIRNGAINNAGKAAKIYLSNRNHISWHILHSLGMIDQRNDGNTDELVEWIRGESAKYWTHGGVPGTQAEA